MNISYNWLKEYIKITETPDELSAILTDIGLEVESIDEVESIKGGLKGIFIGKVMECKPHPDSDHLNLTKVDVGQGELLSIVCGAANVAANQKVVVATVGTKLYDGNKEFEIKKAKIRGEASFGMICAEDEIGIGTSHDGIMVLPNNAVIGMPAAEYFNVTSDYVFTIGLTPNRIDAASHMGVARDLSVYFSNHGKRTYTLPDISNFKIDEKSNPLQVTVLDNEGAMRYAGITIEGVTVTESPEWLKKKMIAIGLNPINNVVDITNFVLQELGLPLHAFDLDQITGNQLIVKKLPQDTTFTTLDGIDRKLNATDLMICNRDEGMCIAGVFGGIKSGVTLATTRLFIESAWFNPVRIRKTARFHGLSTDASFRFERGTDPNMVPIALKRAAMLIKEIAGGKITSDIFDIYPAPASNFEVDFDVTYFHKFAGKAIPVEIIRTIITALEIGIEEKSEAKWKLSVPPYRVDVQRQADISEEILRIYGYNNIEIPEHLTASITASPKPNPEALQDKISDMLVASGYFEMMNNSITKANYFEQFTYFDDSKLVKILNPLSSDLNCMRKSLLFGGLETLRYNHNRQRQNLHFFEFGKKYFCNDQENKQSLKAYSENYRLALFCTGNGHEKNWNMPDTHTSFFDIKAVVENIFLRMGLKSLDLLTIESCENDICREGISFIYQKRELGHIWILNKKVAKMFDLSSDVYYAELDWEFLLRIYKQNKIQFAEIPKFPAVRRDLALLIDTHITFDKMKEIALRTEKQLLKQVGLFDVYEGDKIEEGKKSYALSFILQDDSKTLDDKQIDKSMQKLIGAFERELGAKLR